MLLRDSKFECRVTGGEMSEDEMYHVKKRAIGAMVIICFFIFLFRNSETEIYSNHIVAAHYFANEWPVNFWNSDWSTLQEDFIQIKGDGFQTVIIVVPWREFQPELSPIAYNESALERMKYFFQEAEKYSLQVQIRLGYLNDYYGNENPAQRFYDIVGNQQVRAAWYDYAQTIYELCSEFSNFAGGFITWEDFWHNYALSDYVGGQQNAQLFSVSAGFPDYIEKKYSLEKFNQEYSCQYAAYSEIGVPSRKDLYAQEWFCFIDEFMIKLLSETKKYFPDLTMEVRTDSDELMLTDAKTGRYSHEITYKCGDSSYTAIMYKPTQGVGIPKDKISGKRALTELKKWLKSIRRKNGNKPVYIDQFLFVDNTPGFLEEEIIEECELDWYLINCSTILKQYTAGYGVWAYRDYGNNLLYNPQFAMEFQGWDTVGKVVAVNFEENGKALKMSAGSEIYQFVPPWHKTIETEDNTYILSFKYDAGDEEGMVDISVGSQRKTVQIQGKQELKLEFCGQEDMSVRIRTDVEFVIDNIKLYNFVQSQELYDMNNIELTRINAIRELNAKMSPQ